jgi:hypothetical protein
MEIMKVNKTFRMNQKRAKDGSKVSADPIQFGHPLLNEIYKEVVMLKAGYKGGPRIDEMEPGEYDQRAYIVSSCMPISALLQGGM